MKKGTLTVLAASLGNTLEHYSKALFALLAPFLAPLFFQQTSPTTALISTYLILPLALISKPLGALCFGPLGDRAGRKNVLVITLSGMALATVLMGFIPIGLEKEWIAPTLFALGTLIQNFFAAGETTGGALLILESHPPEKRGLLNAFYESSTLLGILLASFGVTTLSLKGAIETHWPFLYWIGGAVGGASLMIRFLVKEQPPVQKEKKPLLSFLWREKFSLIIIALTSGFSYANYYMLTSFLNGFLPLVSDISKDQAQQANTSLLLIDFFILMFAGGLTLYFSKEKLLLFFALLAAMLAVPLYSYLAGATPLLASCIRLVFLIIGVGFSVILSPFYQEWIPREKRLTLIAFGTALGSQLFGTSACPLGFWMYKKTKWTGAPGLYLMGIALAALWSLRSLQIALKAKQHLKEEKMPLLFFPPPTEKRPSD